MVHRPNEINDEAPSNRIALPYFSNTRSQSYRIVSYTTTLLYLRVDDPPAVQEIVHTQDGAGVAWRIY